MWSALVTHFFADYGIRTKTGTNGTNLFTFIHSIIIKSKTPAFSRVNFKRDGGNSITLRPGTSWNNLDQIGTFVFHF
tara:strand:- start:1775 stop:2005 length:231 start_codon:yes stop_codon:yes gene_type:complete